MNKENLFEIAESLINTAKLLKEQAKTESELETVAEQPQSKFLTIEQAAKFLGLKKATLYRMTHKGILRYSRPTGKRVYFKIEDLEHWQSMNAKKSVYDIESETARTAIKTSIN